MTRTSTSISIRCKPGEDIAVRKAVKKLAGNEGLEAADLVYGLLVEKYGDEFINSVAFFRSKNQTNEKSRVIQEVT